MDTPEHTELGNGLRIANTNNNPYLRIDEFGTLHLRLQRFDEDKYPIPMELELSAGEIIAMAGDFFTDADWTMDLDLPQCSLFESTSRVGKKLIKAPIQAKEENALIKAYNNLAAPDVSRKEIQRIYTITNANYIPFSNTLNFYLKQLMFYFRVKDYGEMLTRNQTHFTPWSIRVYVIGHTIALRYAHLAFELRKAAENESHESSNQDFVSLKQTIKNKNQSPSSDILKDLADRYEAQAYCMELFTFHYYSDHFATGHMSMIGDLRVVLKERFGVWGNILANNLHDEVNRVGVYTINPYDLNPNPTAPPIRSRGDGKVDSCLNKFNRQTCLDGMHASIGDIQSALKGEASPAQKHFAGLKYMPDVDYNSRQHQPLLVFSHDKVYVRNDLSHIRIVSPSDYEALRNDPAAHGYKELKSTFDAMKLVVKLRLFSSLYSGTVQPLSIKELTSIRIDEQKRNPQREPIPEPECAPESEATVFNWRTQVPSDSDKAARDKLGGLANYGLLRLEEDKVERETQAAEGSLSLGI